MSQRFDDEPEYIDDDEYFDPDNPGRSGSRVLGGSGSRRDAYAADEHPPARLRDRRRERGAGPGTAPKAGKSRNPAPAAASSDERRARLAGKRPSPEKQPKSKQTQKQETGGKPVAPSSKGRLSRLRARLSRGERKAGPRAAKARRSRLAAFASGIRGRLPKRSERGPGESSTRPSAAGRRADKSASKRARREGDRPRGEARPQPRASKAPRIESSDWLDLDRKLDILGVCLVFGAIVFTLSALSREQAAISAAHQLIGQLLGWGAVAVPIAMFAAGLWLIIRHFGDEPPTIDPIRLSGLALAFLGLLALFQFVESLSYGGALSTLAPCQAPARPACVDALVQQSYMSQRGGGVLGGWVYSALVNNLTELGGFVLVFMALTIGAMMITRSSMAELAMATVSLGRGLQTRAAQYGAKRRAARLGAGETPPESAPTVRVSKPQPAQLAGATDERSALPPPSGTTMRVPSRLRGLFSFRRRAEAVDVERPAAEAKPRLAERVFKRGSGKSAETPPGEPAPHKAGALERFLNLGDDLPPGTVASAAAPAKPAEAPPPLPRAPAAGPAIEPPPMPTAPKPQTAQSPKRKSTTPRPPRRETPPADDAEPTASKRAQEKRSAAAAPATRSDAADTPAVNAEAESASATQAREQPQLRISWDMPDHINVLDSGSAGQLDQAPLMRQAQIIEDTLAAFGAPGRVVEINSGPVITQYGVEPAYVTARNDKKNRVKVSAIAKLDKDLQLALGARSIRVEAPVPGKGYVGIEVPNPDSALVSLRDVMESRAYQDIESPLAIALGMSVDGAPIAADLTQMPHLLIAGTTGSGKSKCINAIIVSLLATSSPDQVKFIMIDPKRVELTGYNGLPHLVAPVVVELERTVGALRWVTTEMDNRYRKFSKAGARNIIDYNSILDPDLAPMPYIVVIIDELADLMMMAPDDTERAITRIAALARATGIHLVIATQRPSVDVVTGLIKANCPARIAFAVASSIDSKVILDQTGAERLLGKGDMLYLSGDSPAPLRMQGVFVSDDEILRFSRFWKLQGAGLGGARPIAIPAVATGKRGGPAPARQSARQKGGENAQTAFWDMSPTHDAADGAAYEPEEDELYQTAVDMVRRLEKASISLLQRRMRIGYTRAARLMDMMEERGVVGPPKEGSSKPRDVLPQK